MKILKGYREERGLNFKNLHPKKAVGSRLEIVGADGVKNVDVADFETDHNGRESLNFPESLSQHNKV